MLALCLLLPNDVGDPGGGNEDKRDKDEQGHEKMNLDHRRRSSRMKSLLNHDERKGNSSMRAGDAFPLTICVVGCNCILSHRW